MEAVIVPDELRDTKLAKLSVTNTLIQEMKKRYTGLQIIDNASYREVVAAIADVRTTRTGLEKERKEITETARKFIGIVNEEAKRITDLLLEIEEPLKNLKKAEDDKREFEKRESERKEAERVAGIQARIDEIKSRIPDVPTDSDRLAEIIFEVDSIQIDELIFQEMVGQAALAKSSTLNRLNVLLENRIVWEGEEQTRKKEIARLEQLRAEQEKAEQERRIKEAEDRARKDAEEKAMKAEQEKIEAEKRAIEAEKARMETEKRAERERKEREEQERVRQVKETEKARFELLQEVGFTYPFDDLGTMADFAFNHMYSEHKKAWDEEQNRLFIEKLELGKKERVEAEEKARKDREEFERQAKERAEREAREKLERKERERKAMEKAEEAERKRHEALKPDKEKLVGFAIAIGQIECPEVNDERCKDIIIEAMMMIVDIVKFINDKAADL